MTTHFAFHPPPSKNAEPYRFACFVPITLGGASTTNGPVSGQRFAAAHHHPEQ